MRTKSASETPEAIKRDPVCVRCGIVVCGAKTLYTICQACLDEDFYDMQRLAERMRAVNNERSIPDEPARQAGGCSGHSPATLPDEVPF